MKRGALVVAIAIACSITTWTAPGAAQPTGLADCPITGDATPTSRADPDLNSQKNRTEMPTSFSATPFDDIADLEVPDGVSMKHRSKWTDETRQAVATEETRTVRIAGFLVGQKLEGPESTNCHSDNDVEKDIHLWLGNSNDDTKSDAIVVEVTPRVRAQHSTWTRTKFRQLATAKAKIRISGYVLLDEEHLDQVGASRHTAWEIHPIMKIEVFMTGSWKPL